MSPDIENAIDGLSDREFYAFFHRKADRRSLAYALGKERPQPEISARLLKHGDFSAALETAMKLAPVEEEEGADAATPDAESEGKKE